MEFNFVDLWHNDMVFDLDRGCRQILLYQVSASCLVLGHHRRFIDRRVRSGEYILLRLGTICVFVQALGGVHVVHLKLIRVHFWLLVSCLNSGSRFAAAHPVLNLDTWVFIWSLGYIYLVFEDIQIRYDGMWRFSNDQLGAVFGSTLGIWPQIILTLLALLCMSLCCSVVPAFELVVLDIKLTQLDGVFQSALGFTVLTEWLLEDVWLLLIQLALRVFCRSGIRDIGLELLLQRYIFWVGEGLLGFVDIYNIGFFVVHVEELLIFQANALDVVLP